MWASSSNKIVMMVMISFIRMVIILMMMRKIIIFRIMIILKKLLKRVQRKRVRRTLLAFRGNTSHSRPSLLSFSSTLSLLFSKATLLFSVLNVCYVLNILFVCTYNKICLKCLKSEAEYRIEMILFSILTSYFVFLVCFSSVDI